MPTLTIRDVPEQTVRALEKRAQRNQRSMEQELRQMIESQVLDRAPVIAQLKKLRAKQIWTPTAEEIEAWIQEGRP